MKMKDITVGGTYGIPCVIPQMKATNVYGQRSHAWPKIKTVQKVKITEILGKGWAMAEESWVTWDRWMMDKNKKPVTKTKTYKVWTRSLKEI